MLVDIMFPLYAIGNSHAVSLITEEDNAFLPLFQYEHTAGMAAMGLGLPETQVAAFGAQNLLDVIDEFPDNLPVIISEHDVATVVADFKHFLIAQAARARQAKFN